MQRKKIKKLGIRNIISQEEANSIFEGNQLELSFKYATVLKTLWFTALYSTLNPIVYIFGFIGLCLFYWMEKVKNIIDLLF